MASRSHGRLLGMYFGFSDPEHVKRERRKAQELRKSSWWKQQVGPGRCHHCGERFAKEMLTLDHVIPLSRGGKSTKNNCVPSCKPCNADKGHLFSVEKTLLKMEADRRAAGLSTELLGVTEPEAEAEAGSGSGSGSGSEVGAPPERASL